MTTQPTTALVKRTSSLPDQAPRVEPRRAARRPPSTPAPYAYLSTSALKQGVHLVAGSGAGKSRWLARVPIWQALIQNKPFVLIDPTGATVDNLLDKIVRLPFPVQAELWPRLRYLDDGNGAYLVPTPVYTRHGESDTLFEMAHRLPAVFVRQDPALGGAPILGENALLECLVHAGAIAVALDKQLDFVIDLVRQPALYKLALRDALNKQPDLRPAVAYFRELMDPKSGALREKRTGSAKSKLLPFAADPTLLAKFAGTTKRLDWGKELQTRSVVIDLRNEHDPRRRQFKMIWYLKSLMDFIKVRGMAGRGQELLLVIDEIADMLGQRTSEGRSILAEDMEELISRLGRNYGVNVIVAHQNLSQLDTPMQNVLMEMGTQIIGHIANPDDLLRIARQFLHHDAYRVKELEPVWMTIQPNELTHLASALFGGPVLPRPTIVDYQRKYFSPEEQLLLLVNRLQGLGRFEFLVKRARQEGDLRGTLKKISTARLDPGQFPNEAILAPLRAQLAQRDGVPLETLLTEMQGRAVQESSPQASQQVNAPTAPKKAARLKGSSSTHDQPHALPINQPGEPVSSDPKPEPAPQRGADEQVWQ